MDIITGYRGEPHITSQQDRDANMGVLGNGSFITDMNQRFYASVINSNTIRITDGVLCMQGCFAEIPLGTYDTVTIANGTQGMKRRDLIVARYTKDAVTDVENIALVVIQGTPSASSPATPSYTSDDIAAGALLVDFPLYRVDIDGVNISGVTLLANVIPTVFDIMEDIGDTALPDGYTTITAAINAAYNKIQSYSGKAPTPTEASGGSAELYVRYNGQVVSAYNTPSTSYIVIIQSRAVGDAATELYSVAIDTADGAGTKIDHIAGSNTVHTAFVGSTQGSVFIRTTGKAVGYYCDVTVIKTR